MPKLTVLARHLSQRLPTAYMMQTTPRKQKTQVYTTIVLLLTDSLTIYTNQMAPEFMGSEVATTDNISPILQV